MSDIFSKKKRSQIMSKIGGKDTRIEKIVRSYLFSKGFRFRKNDKRYPGTPDIVLPKYNTIIFVHGCFWHGHENCSYSKLPETRKDFWQEKITRNVKRDRRVKALLENHGWRVIIIWQCEIKNIKLRTTRLSRLVGEIQGENTSN
ncbi:DNA mismatch endonuclease Vsr [bacterium]|nr:DNA mismatch endonuclease Vsr [bacterium]